MATPRKPGRNGPAEAGAAPAAETAPAAAPQLPLLYRSLSMVEAARHGGKSLKSQIGYGFARGTHAVLLNGNEFDAAARHYPVVFAPAPQLAALAVLGVRPNINLFIDARDGWRPGTYIPAYVRRYPFIFHESDDHQQYTLCIDEASGALEDGGARPLFVDGKPTELTQNALQFCAAFQRDHVATRAFVTDLDERGLLIPNEAAITFVSGEKLTVTGFHIIDRDRFAALPDSVILEWRRKGWLAWVYAHFVSQGSWSLLADLAGTPPVT
ncbi:MAG TPA: SapC family protein [Stellaceae bacterium]|nr:SapC family protein [Stellaceae bacterium]